MGRLGFLLLLSTSTLLTSIASASGASFTPIGDLPGGDFASAAHGISGDGRIVVGQSRAVDQPPGFESFEWRAFIWDATEGMRPVPATQYAQDATATSADGSTVIGNRAFVVNSADRMFVWDAVDGMQDLGSLVPGSYSGSANAVSADGSIIVGTTGGESWPDEAFIWTAEDGIRSLGTLDGRPLRLASGVSADGTRVVGVDASGRAYIWDEQAGARLLFPEENFASRPSAISADGTTVVGFHRSEGRRRGFRWTDGIGSIDLDGGVGDLNTSDLAAVSADGSTIVGSMQNAALDPQEAMIWTEAGGIQSLRVLLSTLGVDLTGWQLQRATGISYDGRTITGTGTNPDGRSEGWVAVIPEPSTCVLLFLGLASLSDRRRVL